MNGYDYEVLLSWAWVIVTPVIAWAWKLQSRIQKLETENSQDEKRTNRLQDKMDKITDKLSVIAEDVASIKGRLTTK